MDELKCLRCGSVMKREKRETLQLGQASWLFGTLGNLISGGIDVDIIACPNCGKLEFFAVREKNEENTLQKTCPECGKQHHIADRRCPSCGHEYF